MRSRRQNIMIIQKFLDDTCEDVEALANEEAAELADFVLARESFYPEIMAHHAAYKGHGFGANKILN